MLVVKFAIVITVYKRYNYVREAIRSALEQSLKPSQIIVVADDVNRLRDFQGITLVEGDYLYHGKIISEGVRAVQEDVDAIAFLEDDDLFDRDKLKILNDILNENKIDVVLVHNFQRFIDVQGNEVRGRAVDKYIRGQPHSSTIITQDNVIEIAHLYPYIYHNLSSITVRKKFLDSISDKLSNFWLALDFVMFYFALQYGKILHIPNSLTYYRLGSGETTQFYSSQDLSDFTKYLQKQLCIEKKYLKTFRVLNTFLKDCKQCKLLVERQLLISETLVAFLDGRFDCILPESPAVSTREITWLSFKSLLNRQIGVGTFLKTLLSLSGLYVLGKKRMSDMYINYLYKLHQKNL